MFAVDDTIVAIASAPGGAARGIVRISGPEVVAVVARCFTAQSGVRLADVRRPTRLAGEVNISAHSPLPADLYLWPGERSYTRQPVAELHTLGSPPLVARLVSTFCTAGARLAERGEFTLRAFLAGRIDLTEAEAVLGVIDATSRRQYDVALAQLAGGVAGPIERLRNDLLDLLAELEAGLDFVEEDIEFITRDALEARLIQCGGQLAAIEAEMIDRGQSRDAMAAVLWGWPNVGKSSLFNALVGGEAALVSAQAGTTRDYLSATLDLDGVPCTLVDVAGIDADQSAITRSAQRLAGEQLGAAAVRVLCLDSTRPLNDWERQACRQLAEHDGLVVLTKCDQPRRLAIAELPQPPLETSSHESQGLDALRAALRERAVSGAGETTGVVAATAQRAAESLRLARIALATALAQRGEELVAAELRTALDELGKVVGAVYTDDILDRIFSRFCIGK